MCTVVFVGLSPPTQCESPDCRFITGSRPTCCKEESEDCGESENCNDKDYCCMEEWGEDPNIINKDLATIQERIVEELIQEKIADELNLQTIPFREAIGTYQKGELMVSGPGTSHMQDDTIHPNELGYFEMAKIATKKVNEVLQDYSLLQFEAAAKAPKSKAATANSPKAAKAATAKSTATEKGVLVEVGPDGVPQRRRGDSEGTDEAVVKKEHIRVKIGTDGSMEAYEAQDSLARKKFT